MKKIYVISALAALCLMAGCSSTAKEATDAALLSSKPADANEMYEKAYREGMGPNRRDATVIVAPGSRGGAALRPGEEVHVLYYRYPNEEMLSIEEDHQYKPTVDLNEAVTTMANLDDDDDSDPITFSTSELNSKFGGQPQPANSQGTTNGLNQGTGFSQYELSRWERYCAGHPDNLDVKFIKQVGGHSRLPEFMKANCNPKTAL